jgi:hypothetical protein
MGHLRLQTLDVPFQQKGQPKKEEMTSELVAFGITAYLLLGVATAVLAVQDLMADEKFQSELEDVEIELVESGFLPVEARLLVSLACAMLTLVSFSLFPLIWIDWIYERWWGKDERDRT